MCKRHKGLYVKTACQLFGKSKQAYYQNKSDGEERLRREARIVDVVKQFRAIAPGTGARKLWLLTQSVLHEERTPGRDAFFALLDRHGLQLPRPKPRRTTNSNHRFHKYKNLIKGIIPVEPNQQWVADITYVDLEQGACYLHLITDAYSHRILGRCLADTLEATYTLEALKMAVKTSGRTDLCGLIHHSDRGVQYCCNEYTAYLTQMGAQISMTEDYNPTDNAIAERVNGIIKTELLYQIPRPKTRLEASNKIEAFINYYNCSRPHMSIGCQTPNAVYQQTGLQRRVWKNISQNSCRNKKNVVTLQPDSEDCLHPDLVDRSTKSGQSQSTQA